MFVGGTWDLSSSVPGNSDLGFQHLINTPRILELDVNRMMYGQNQVSVTNQRLNNGGSLLTD